MIRQLKQQMLRRGAELEIGEMQQRIDALRQLLKATDVDRYTGPATDSGKSRMSAAARAAVSKRMKAYWRKRRKASKA